MHISGSILITAAFVSAMLILQESSATAQTCEQTQHDACSSSSCCLRTMHPLWLHRA